MRGRAGLEGFGKRLGTLTINVARPLTLALSRKGRGDGLRPRMTGVKWRSQSCVSSASAPETSALPGASSTFSAFTTPSSTIIE